MIRVQGTENLLSVGVQEDATPVNPLDSGGGVGSMSFSYVTAGEGDLGAVGETVTVSGALGSIFGEVVRVSDDDGIITVSAMTSLEGLNEEHTIKPFSGTLSSAVQALFTTAGVTTPLSVDTSVAGRSVTLPGAYMSVWSYLKEFLIANRVELTFLGGSAVVRPLRTMTLDISNAQSVRRSADKSQPSKTLSAMYHSYQYGTQREVYPVDNTEASVLSVGAGETVETEVTVDAGLISINQPTVVDFVENRSYEGTSGVYAIVGGDNKPVTAAQWTAQGGSVAVEITDDPSVVKVSVTGPWYEDAAPYRVAMSDGKTEYNSLHITGTAVTWSDTEVVFSTGSDTGADPLDVPTRFASTRGDAINALTDALNMSAGATHTISVSLPTETEFGNNVGARFRYRDAMYRVTSVNTQQSGSEVSGTMDTTMGDFNAAHGFTTFAQFNALFSGDTFAKFNARSLRTS